MKKFWALAALLFGFSLSAQAAPVPVQRVDVMNMLWNSASQTAVAGLTPTSVLLKFSVSGGSAPCYSVTLPFEGSTTFFSGTGYPCTTAVQTMSVTPVAAAITGTTAVYAAPTDYSFVDTDFSTQLVIQQATAPVFDPNNGALSTPGTVSISHQDHY